jgi:hypothetical protein
MNIFAERLPASVYREVPAKVRQILLGALLNLCLTSLIASGKLRTRTSYCGMRRNLRRECWTDLQRK